MALGRHGRDARQGTFGSVHDRDDVATDEDGAGPDASGPAGGGGAADLTPDVVDEITWYMREHKVTRTQVAAAMGVSPGRVAQLLSGRETLTPCALGAVLAALGARVEITLHPAADRAAA